MISIVWTHPAITDLYSIDAYIARDNPSAATQVIENIREGIERLRDFPSLGPEGMIAGTRELALSPLPYVAAYRLKGGVIQVLAILHTARDREHALAGRV